MAHEHRVVEAEPAERARYGAAGVIADDEKRSAALGVEDLERRRIAGGEERRDRRWGGFWHWRD
jgi:hypothetical protein